MTYFSGCLRIAVLLLCVACLPVWSYIEHPGSRFPPTKGEIWPKPQSERKLNGTMTVLPKGFEFKVVGKTCEILSEGIGRYTNIIFKHGTRYLRSSKRHSKIFYVQMESNLDNVLEYLNVNLTSECEEWPSLNMDESYTLKVNIDKASTLTSKSIWGILRGLESFSQLIYLDSPKTRDLSIRPTIIYDFPRFSHRGILLDTSRHYISVTNILKLIDGLVYNKLNVFHWHIVDDQSFPYESIRYPSLSGLGAFYELSVYTQKDIQRIIEYARIRGVRVMPEFDTPGHTRSWGVAYPELLTQCYGPNNEPNGDLGPMDPIKNSTYTFMNNLLKEIVQVFPEKYVHLGGDEVDFDCWESNPDIREYMHANNLTAYNALEEIYIQKIVDSVNNLNSFSVVWQEVFVNGVKLPQGTVVHAWTGDQKTLLFDITQEGLPALLSSCWYLDHLQGGGDWEKYYDCDPHDFPGNDTQKKLVMGGEACMWGEVVDDSNVLSRIFPRASATAEKLWSAVDVTDKNAARYRLEEHYCRMKRRDIPAQPPSGPGFCF